MQGLEERIAIVTGAASPIGRAISVRLREQGVKLMLGDLDAEGVSDIAEQLGALSIAGDLSEETLVRQMVAKTVDHYGQLDILVNNAGGGLIRPFLEHDMESLTATMNRNLWTTIWACHATLPHMVEQGFGRIVNIGADSVRNGLWDHAGYNAAKGGVHGLTTGIAREFATSGVTINTVAPCMVATPMVKAAMEQGNPLIQKFTEV
ncbi:MAG: 2,3-dihydroxy-2,3-dihydro-p-cumate dehydrogenase, partial [Candidatus Azotimanducaceae bacterium]